jgi:hypothetical protein
MVDTIVTTDIIIALTLSTTKPNGIDKLPSTIQSNIFKDIASLPLTYINNITDETIEVARSAEVVIPIKIFLSDQAKIDAIIAPTNGAKSDI